MYGTGYNCLLANLQNLFNIYTRTCFFFQFFHMSTYNLDKGKEENFYGIDN